MGGGPRGRAFANEIRQHDRERDPEGSYPGWRLFRRYHMQWKIWPSEIEEDMNGCWKNLDLL